MCEQGMKDQDSSPTGKPAGENQTVGEPATVLIVDDNTAEAAAYHEILGNAGYDVLLAEEGRQGLEILRANPEGIDLVILDWILPDMSGDQWLELFLEVAPDVKVVFVSGKFITEALRAQLRAKVCEFLKKPFTGAQLLDAVEKGLQSDRS